MSVKLNGFSNTDFDRGAARGKELLWLLLRGVFFDRSMMPCYRLRRGLLRRFGAQVGAGVLIKPQVKITFPWRLTVGEHSWLGEESWILNLAPVRIGSNVCISQRVMLCTGNHDWNDPNFRLLTESIHVDDGAWLCANVFVGPGVTIGRNSVVTAGSIVTGDLPADMICSGNPCQPVKPRQEEL